MINSLQFLAVMICCLLFSNGTAAQVREFQWPEGKKAAVCLSYDDGTLSQLDQAIPDLNEAGFTGTFYLTGKNLHPEFVDRWRDAASQGHELGCHSLFHPCSGEFDWVPGEYRTEDYTLRRMLDEAKVMNQFLYAVDGMSRRTYAYPCYEKEVGGIDYVDSLSRSGLFVGARGGKLSDPLPLENLELFDIPSMSVTDELSFEKVIAYIDKAVENGTVAVFCFHGIGGDYIVTSREYHRQIITYLKEHEKEIWVATLVDIATFLDKAESQ